jgi:putative hydrolase of the HAD superfamily
MPKQSATEQTQAVVFDLDDILYAERDYVRSGYGAVARHLESPAEKTKTISRDDLLGWLWDRFRAGQAAGAFDALNEHFQLGLAKPQITQLVELYRSHLPDIRPREGIPQLLADLAGTNRLGLLSDGFLPAQQLKLDALGLREYFDAVIFTESLGPKQKCWKPSPAGFEAIVEKLLVPHPSCCYVGDNPAKDFVAPNTLGWRTIQLLLPGQVHSGKPAPPGGAPRTIVASIEELRGAFDLA